MEKLLNKHEVEREFHQILKDYKCAPNCSWCCCHFILRINPNSPANYQFKQRITGAIKRTMDIELQEHLGPTVIQQYGLCKNLDPATKKCKDYYNRPRICKTFFCLRDLVPHTFLQIAKVAFDNSNGDGKKFTEIINRLITYYQSGVKANQEEEIAREKAKLGKEGIKKKIKELFGRKKNEDTNN